ncbi:MAG: hypothetical protein ACXWMC_00090 [Syntrophales bacterium]
MIMSGRTSYSARPLFLFMIFSTSLAIASPYFINSTPLPRTEELEYSIIPLIVYAKQLLHGTVGYWYGNAGLGIPWPIPHTMTHVPTILLFAFAPAFTAVGTTVLVHAAVSGFYVLRIADRFEFSQSVAVAFLFTLLAAAPLEYLYVSDATAAYIGWTTLPIVFYYLCELIHGQYQRRVMLKRALALGIILSYGVLNGHSGIFLTYLIALCIFVFAHGRLILSRMGWFILAAAIIVAISGEKVLFLTQEMAYFPPTVPRLQYWLNGGLKDELWNLFIKPLFIPTRSALSNPGLLVQEFVNANWMSRSITFGPIFALLATIGATKIASAPMKRPLLISFWVCMVLMLWPISLLPKLISATWTFRDPAILFGTVLAAWTLDERVKRNAPTCWMKPQRLAMAQTILAIIAAFPFVYGSWFRESPTSYTVEKYNSIVASIDNAPILGELNRVLSSNEDNHGFDHIGYRFLASSRVKSLMERDEIVDVGGLSNVGIVHDMEEVSFISKGVSQDEIHPSQSLPYGLITGERFRNWRYNDDKRGDWTIQDQALLTFLGIRALVVATDEHVTIPNLIKGPAFIARDGTKLTVYRNDSVLPRAFFVESKQLESVQPRSNCSATHLTCLDLSTLVTSINPAVRPVNLWQDQKQITMTFSKANQIQELILTIMYRPEWTIKPQFLSLQPVSFHGIIRIAIPPGVDGLSMEYRPLGRIVARTVSICTLILTLGILLILSLPWQIGPMKN